jgi:hypothetical protein
MHRRDVLKLAAAGPVAAAFHWTRAEVEAASRRARAAGAAFEPAFFSPPEYETVRLLVDLILPRDERSGSATEAGVPEFIDFMMTESEPERQTAMRGGLAWLDAECWERFGRTFLDCTEPERAAVLDDIAWPERARPELSHGVAFFSSFRDLTATGFWTSKMGMEDLEYLGNEFLPEWNGCPPETLKRLGLPGRS